MTVSKGSTPLSSSCGEVAELTWLSGLNWVPGRGFVTRYLGHRLEFLGLKSTRETVRHVIGRRTPHDDVVKAATVTAAAVRVFFLNKIRVSFKNMENDCTFFVKIYVFDRCWLHKAIYRLYKHFHLHIDCVCVCACVCVCVKVTTVPSAQSLGILDFSFSDFDLSDTETTLATIRMFVDLNLVQNFQMKYTVRAVLGTFSLTYTFYFYFIQPILEYWV